MKKGVLLSVFLVLTLAIFISLSSAKIMEIEKEPIDNVIAAELTIPASFNMTIKNLGATDSFQVYTYLDIILSPKGGFRIEGGEEKNFILKVYPSEKIRKKIKGDYIFTYYIKSSLETEQDKLTVKILPLKDILDVIFPSSVSAEDKTLIILLSNKEKIDFSNIKVKIKSDLLTEEFNTSLGAEEEKEIELPLDIGTLNAGSYPFKTELTVDNEKVVIEKQVLLEEITNIITEEKKSGNIFYPITTIKKKNEGNKAEDVIITIQKNSFARIFTAFNIEPDEESRKKATITFTWKKQLEPGEVFMIKSRTNYLLPIMILLAIILIALLINTYYKTELVLKKKAVKVKTKGGEFALKILLFAKARKSITDIKIEDTLPTIAELHERFGTVAPKIDKTKKKLEWNIKHLGRNEEHVFSYIIYSKIGVIGKLEVPKAKATYKNKEGKTKTASSNRVFILSEEKVS